jgi:hypothetical protein
VVDKKLVVRAPKTHESPKNAADPWHSKADPIWLWGSGRVSDSELGQKSGAPSNCTNELSNYETSSLGRI